MRYGMIWVENVDQTAGRIRYPNLSNIIVSPSYYPVHMLIVVQNISASSGAAFW
jgi:hypothetical protein